MNSGRVGYDIKDTVSQQGLHFRAREPMTSMSSDVSTLKEHLDSKYTEFKTTLQQYRDEYVKFFSKADVDNSIQKATSKYLKQLIYGPENKTVYYVNKYGYTRELPSDRSLDDASCPSNQPVISNVSGQPYSLFKKGASMFSGEKCGLENSVIRNETNDTYAWVDEKGMKHVFNDWKTKDTSCPTNYVNVTNEYFNQIPTGSVLNKGDKCIVQSDQIRSLMEINKLFDKLILLSNDIVSTLSQLIKVSDGVDYEKQMNDIKTQMIQLQKENKVLDKSKTHQSNYRDILSDSRLEYRENYTKYMMWMAGIAVLSGVTIHQMLK